MEQEHNLFRILKEHDITPDSIRQETYTGSDTGLSITLGTNEGYYLEVFAANNFLVTMRFHSRDDLTRAVSLLMESGYYLPQH